MVNAYECLYSLDINQGTDRQDMHLKRDHGAEDLRSQSFKNVLGNNIKAEGVVGAETKM